MTQQPFSRPGAIDLSALKKPAPAAPSSGGRASSAGGGGGSAYSLTVTEENFQQVVESSMTAPVLLAFYSASRLPESEQMAEDQAEDLEEQESWVEDEEEEEALSCSSSLASASDSFSAVALSDLASIDVRSALARRSSPRFCSAARRSSRSFSLIDGFEDEVEDHLTTGTHPHRHGEDCGHPAVQHGDHVDYLHDGHRHAPHERHYDEH